MTTAEQCEALRAELLDRGDSEEQASAAVGVLLYAVSEGAAIDRIWQGWELRWLRTFNVPESAVKRLSSGGWRRVSWGKWRLRTGG